MFLCSPVKLAHKMLLLTLAAVFIALFYLFFIKPHKHWKKKGIPYVKPLPVIGNVGANVLGKKSFADLVNEWYTTYSDKRYVGFYQFSSPTLLIRDLQLIKKIAVKEFDVFADHRMFASEDIDPLWSKNLFAMKGGERWQDLRATLSPSFTSSKMRMMFGLMQKCAKQFTSYFLKQGDLVTMEMMDAFTRLANDVVATTAFGVYCNSLENRENEFYLMGRDATNFSGFRSLKFFLYAISPFFMKVLGVGMFSKKVSTFFRGIIKETIRIREANNIVRPDMVHLLMEARKGRLKNEDCAVIESGFAAVQEADLGKAHKRKKAEITDDDITAQALVFFLGGFDTVSRMLCFACYELAVNPDIQQKLRKELRKTEEECKGQLTYEALMGMKYLDMFISEILRKWPPGIIGDRVSVKPYTIEPELPGEKPVTLDAGTNVWFPIYTIHRDPQYYPDPEKFDPERFSDENKQKIKPFTFLPFGIGPRNCIGSRFALLEGKLVLAEIVSKFEIVPVEKTRIPIQLDTKNFNILPENGLWLGLKSLVFT